MRLLFVCTSGYRAEVASIPFIMNGKHEHKSVGIYNCSEQDMKSDVEWADKVICITKMHYDFMKRYFFSDKIVNLDLSEYASDEEIINASKMII
jgi:predicted protein tyrosine phosphatase